MSLALAIHGGAGFLEKAELGPEGNCDFKALLRESLDKAWKMLREGATALDTVEFAVKILEDCSCFNAGRGSVLTHDGKIEMDAAIMDGATGGVGGVTGVSLIRNPIHLARRVMEDGQFVLLSGKGAEAFAARHRIPREPSQYFITSARFEELLRAREANKVPLEYEKYGTVGAVACDSQGNLAAGTSTGGLTNKRYGRIGDSAIVGAGTFADNRTCAVSCTGYGEEFICQVVAHDVSCRMKYLKEDLVTASRHVIGTSLPPFNGRGGLVAVDGKGEVSLVFNTEGMYRAWARSDNSSGTGIFRD